MRKHLRYFTYVSDKQFLSHSVLRNGPSKPLLMLMYNDEERPKVNSLLSMNEPGKAHLNRQHGKEMGFKLQLFKKLSHNKENTCSIQKIWPTLYILSKKKTYHLDFHHLKRTQIYLMRGTNLAALYILFHSTCTTPLSL